MPGFSVTVEYTRLEKIVEPDARWSSLRGANGQLFTNGRFPPRPNNIWSLKATVNLETFAKLKFIIQSWGERLQDGVQRALVLESGHADIAPQGQYDGDLLSTQTIDGVTYDYGYFAYKVAPIDVGEDWYEQIGGPDLNCDQAIAAISYEIELGFIELVPRQHVLMPPVISGISVNGNSVTDNVFGSILKRAATGIGELAYWELRFTLVSTPFNSVALGRSGTVNALINPGDLIEAFANAHDTAGTLKIFQGYVESIDYDQIAQELSITAVSKAKIKADEGGVAAFASLTYSGAIDELLTEDGIIRNGAMPTRFVRDSVLSQSGTNGSTSLALDLLGQFGCCLVCEPDTDAVQILVYQFEGPSRLPLWVGAVYENASYNSRKDRTKLPKYVTVYNKGVVVDDEFDTEPEIDEEIGELTALNPEYSAAQGYVPDILKTVRTTTTRQIIQVSSSESEFVTTTTTTQPLLALIYGGESAGAFGLIRSFAYLQSEADVQTIVSRRVERTRVNNVTQRVVWQREEVWKPRCTQGYNSVGFASQKTQLELILVERVTSVPKFNTNEAYRGRVAVTRETVRFGQSVSSTGAPAEFDIVAHTLSFATKVIRGPAVGKEQIGNKTTQTISSLSPPRHPGLVHCIRDTEADAKIIYGDWVSPADIQAENRVIRLSTPNLTTQLVADSWAFQIGLESGEIEIEVPVEQYALTNLLSGTDFYFDVGVSTCQVRDIEIVSTSDGSYLKLNGGQIELAELRQFTHAQEAGKIPDNSQPPQSAGLSNGIVEEGRPVKSFRLPVVNKPCQYYDGQGYTIQNVTGLPPGLTVVRDVVRGTPTTAGIYTISYEVLYQSVVYPLTLTLQVSPQVPGFKSFGISGRFTAFNGGFATFSCPPETVNAFSGVFGEFSE
jgi:hypothetical protein